MENFGYTDKIKDNLIKEMDNIIDEKRNLFEQIKGLEKEEILLKHNISFFENYIKLIDQAENNNSLNNVKISLEEFLSMIPKEKKRIQVIIKKKEKEKEKEKDIIEENIKAFDEAEKYKYEDRCEFQHTANKSMPKEKPEKKEKENIVTEEEYIDNVIEQDIRNIGLDSNIGYDENYFRDLIKRKFDT